MRKRCWKTVLSAILASAMLFTSVPTNLTMTVHAEELGMEDMSDDVSETEVEDEQENQSLTGNEAGGEQNVQNPVGGTKVVKTTEDNGNNGAGAKAADATNPAVVNADKTVSFTCDPSVIKFADGNNDDAEVTAEELLSVWVKSEANGWKTGEDALATLTKGEDGVWTGDSDVIETPGTYQYLFMGEIASGSDNVFMTGGNKTFQILAEGETPIVSPVVSGRSVTFRYKNDTASQVRVAGNMTDWASGAKEMKKNDGIWELTLTLSPGNYLYKFIVGDDDWQRDPNNGNVVGDNSAFTITGLGDTSIQAKVNATSNLPTEIKSYYTEDGSTVPKAVTYALTSETSAKGITLGTSGDQQTVTVPDSLEEGDKFTLTASNKEDTSETCTVTVELVSIMPDPAITGPVTKDGKTIFYYYNPTADIEVYLAGSMNSWNETSQEMTYNPDTGYWTFEVSLGIGEHEYKFIVDGDWITDPLNPPPAGKENSVVKVTAEEASSNVSPVIDGKKVTFLYENDKVDAVYVAGTMNNWDGSAPEESEWKMTKNEETGYWELIKEMSAKKYAYKYVTKTGSTVDWVNDPWNKEPQEGGNNIFVVTGLEDIDLEVERGGKKVELAKTLTLWNEAGDSTETTVETYALSTETAAAKYKDAIELSTVEGKTFISLKEDFPEDVKAFTLTATDADSNTATVNVSVVDKKYKYTIYYYDADHYNEEKPEESAALWIYSDDVSGKLYDLDKTEELNGLKWLKAEVELSFTKLSIIPRNPAPETPWVWQDETRTYDNEEAADDVTLYIVFDDGHRIYTEPPQNVNFTKRYLVAEYARKDAIENWNLYTWNSGYGDSVFAEFEATDSLNGLAQVRVRRGLESLSFCIAKIVGGDTEHWADQDGGDYLVDVPVEQNVVKVQIKQGEGIVKTYPYNIGYELAPADQKIHFYYRDDDAFLAGSEGGHDTVVLEVGTLGDDGKVSFETKPMTYDTDKQRYCLDYELKDVTKAATYYYRYYLDSATYVTDDFNDKKETIDEKEYSVLNYDMIDAEMEAALQNDTMDYNDNNVLSIKVNAKDSEGKPIEGTEEEELNVVKKATVDLRALGGSKEAEIDPELLAITIAVKQGTAAGEKTLPITIEDIYGNEHKTEAKVTVVDRNKGSDFDWDEAVVYFAVTDRFFDGNASNNEGDAPGSYDKTTNDGLNSSYHGGDFAGLTQKLDYLKELGVNTIWITPIVENQTVANSVDNPTVKEAWGYTGYWAKDFTKLDSHLGTEAEFSALLNAAHAKGMKVMVDVVLNHTGYGDEITNYYNSNFKNEDGEVIRMLRNDDEVVNGHDQKSSLSGLPDFRTEDPEVRELVVEWQSNWISKYPIDYYRVDTVKHVDDTTWSAFKNALTEINPDFKMIGEWAGAGYATDTGMLDTGRMDALLDFDFPKQAANFAAGDLAGVEGFLTARNGEIDNTASLGSWLSNHDQQGFVHRLTSEKKIDEEYAKELALVAASLQLTAKGQVYIYYGEEIGVSDGEENYPYQTNRRDFDWSKVTNDNKALAHYKKMISIRNMYSEVLAKGDRKTISTENGLDVFTRSYGGTTLTIALNIENQEQKYTLTKQAPNTTLVDYYSGKQIDVDASGNALITVPAAADGGTVVLGTENFRIDLPADGGMQIRTIPNQTYTGLSIKLPEDVLQVYAGSTRLTAGVDYTVSYKNNKAVGTATVTIKGKGNYKDTVTAQFNIVPKPVKELEIVYKDFVVENNKEQKPLSKIMNNGKKLTAKDYQVEYYRVDASGNRTSSALKGVKEAGTYDMVVIGLNNYTGEITKKITVTEKGQGAYMTTLQISLEYTSVDYVDGKPFEPTVTVRDKNKGEDEQPKLDIDYTVSYENNVNVGTANVIITGVSAKGYYGSVTKTFKIKGTELSKVAQVNTAKWQKKVTIDVTGSAQQTNAELTAKKGQTVSLKKGKDYTVSYSNNTKPGTATVTFTGAGAYTGTIKKTFKVTAIAWTQADVDKNLVIKVEQNAPYSKKGATTPVTVTYKNKILAEGKDYKLTYKNNKALSEGLVQNKMPFVEVTGMGSYSGKVKAGTFTIVKANLADAKAGITVTVPDAEQKSGCMSKPVVKAADGTYLTNGTDYTVKYQKQVENGDLVDVTENDTTIPVNTCMWVTVEGQGNYTGSVTKDYRIVGTSISKATIVVKAQTYTGQAITLDANDFSKARIGKNNLTFGKDFEIVEGSYEKNVNKGNATVIVRGIGENYGGEKKVTFRITSSGMRWWWNLFG